MLFLSFVLVIIFVATTFAARHELQAILNRSNKIFRNEKWVNVKPALRSNVASNSTGESMTFIAYEYLHSSTCGDKADVASGFAFNTCFVGSDETGKVLGSGIYRLDDDSTQYFEARYTEYSNADCTGTITYDHFLYSTKACMTDGTSGTSVRYETVKTSDVYTKLAGGFLTTYFDTKDHCVYSVLPAANTLAWINYNTCLPTDDGKSVQYIGCSNGQVKINNYSDAQCTTVSQKIGAPLANCEANEQESPSNDSGFYYRTLVTESCL